MKTFFILSTYTPIFFFEEESERYPKSSEEKSFLICSNLVYKTGKVADNCTDLLIIDPIEGSFTRKDLLDYFEKEFLKQNRSISRKKEIYLYSVERIMDLLKKAILLSREDLGTNSFIRNPVKKIDIKPIKRLIGSNKILFCSNLLDPYMVTILGKFSNIEGYHISFPGHRMEIAIQDIKDYMGYSELVYNIWHRRPARSICFNPNIFRRRDIRQFKDFTKGIINRLLIISTDNFINELIAIEFMDKIGNLVEYKDCKSTPEISEGNPGYIFYNLEVLTPSEERSLLKKIESNKNKPVILFSKSRPISLKNRNLPTVEFPKLSNKLKMEFLIYLTQKRDNCYNSTEYSIDFSPFLDSLHDVDSINAFIINNKIQSGVINSPYYWYKFRKKSKAYSEYIFKHEMELGKRYWFITGELIKNPIKLKYYPNKCIMYLAVLAKKYPEEISAINLLRIVNNWQSELSSTRQKKKTFNRETTSKTEAENAANTIRQAIITFFRANEDNLDEEIIRFLSLFDEDIVSIGSKCKFNPKGKPIKFIIEDNFLDEHPEILK